MFPRADATCSPPLRLRHSSAVGAARQRSQEEGQTDVERGMALPIHSMQELRSEQADRRHVIFARRLRDISPGQVVAAVSNGLCSVRTGLCAARA
eukprot:2928863-Rhodomonas_salina.1